MNLQLLLFLVAAFCMLVTHCGADGSDSNVLTLTPETFETILNENRDVLVVYSARWCGHCKSLQTVLTRAATRLKYKKVQAKIAVLDAALHAKFSERRGITGYPTLHYYKSGVYVNEYVGDRTDRAIAEFVARMAASGDVVTRLSSIRDLLNFCSAQDRGEFAGVDVDESDDEDAEDSEDADLRELYRAEGARPGGVGVADVGGKVPKASVAGDDDVLTLVLGLFPRQPSTQPVPPTQAPDGRQLTEWEKSMPSEKELIARGRRGKTTPTPLVSTTKGTNTAPNQTVPRSKAEEAYLSVASQFTAARFAITDNEFLLSHFDVREDTVIAFGGGISVTAQVIGRVSLRPPTSNPTASAYMPPGLTAAEKAERAEAARDSAKLRLLTEMRERILSFLVTHAMPPITPFGPATLGLIESSLVKVHLLLFLDADSDHSTLMVEDLSAVAQKYRGRVLLIQVPSSEHQILSLFGVSVEQFPQIMLLDLQREGAMQRYHMTAKDLKPGALEELSHDTGLTGEERLLRMLRVYTESVDNYISSFFSGSLQPTYLSAEATTDLGESGTPLSNVNGRPVTIVGSQFTRAVMETDVDVFLFIYAPWCAYCKAFEGVLRELSQYYSDDNEEHVRGNELLLVRMDGTANEVQHPSVSVVGYPTFYLFLRGSKHLPPIEYDGDRSADDIVNFVTRHQKERDDRSAKRAEEARMRSLYLQQEREQEALQREHRQQQLLEQRKRIEALDAENSGGSLVRRANGVMLQRIKGAMMQHHDPHVEPFVYPTAGEGTGEQSEAGGRGDIATAGGPVDDGGGGGGGVNDGS